MDKRFEPAKDINFRLLYFIFPALLLIFFMIDTFQGWQNSNASIGSVGILLLFVLLMGYSWRLFQNAHYKIKNDQLIYRFGWNKGTVPIQDIQSIIYAFMPAAGKRPTLHFKGLKINYGAGYSLFIAPKDPQDFILSIQAVNPDIKITRSK